MIIKKYYQNNGKTVYKCDRCEKVIDTGKEDRYRISIASSKNNGHTIRGYDLCKHCCQLLIKGIERGVTRDK